MDENIQKILKMVEEGKIDSQKASELIQALKEKETSEQTPSVNGKAKALRIKVNSSKGEDVDINFPLKFIKASIKAFGKLPVNIKGSVDGVEDIDMKAITDAIENDIEGDIMNIKTGKGDDIKIVIE